MRYAILCLISILLSLAGTTLTRGQDKNASARLDAKLRVMVAEDLRVSCRFLLSGKADQSFENEEYRYVVFDKDGNQVDDALRFKLPVRTIKLPMDKRSVSDTTDATIVADKLRDGEEYYLIVSVRNLTGLAKFTKVGPVAK